MDPRILKTSLNKHPLQAFIIGKHSIRNNICFAAIVAIPSYLIYAAVTKSTRQLHFGFESVYQIATVAQQTGEQVLTGIGKNNIPCMIIAMLSFLTAILMNVLSKQTSLGIYSVALCSLGFGIIASMINYFSFKRYLHTPNWRILGEQESNETNSTQIEKQGLWSKEPSGSHSLKHHNHRQCFIL